MCYDADDDEIYSVVHRHGRGERAGRGEDASEYARIDAARRAEPRRGVAAGITRSDFCHVPKHSDPESRRQYRSSISTDCKKRIHSAHRSIPKDYRAKHRAVRIRVVADAVGIGNDLISIRIINLRTHAKSGNKAADAFTG